VTWLPHYFCWLWQCRTWFMPHTLLVTGIELPCEIRIQERRYSYRIVASGLLHNILFNNICVCVCVCMCVYRYLCECYFCRSQCSSPQWYGKAIPCGFIRKSKFLPPSSSLIQWWT
jgi:hypothetical protein